MRVVGALVSCASVLLLVLLPMGCEQVEGEQTDLYERVIEGNVFDTTPVRGDFLPLRYRRSGFEYRCSECHQSIAPTTRRNPLRAEHAEIEAAFNHGINTACLNCHHPEDRNVYVDHDGTPIPADQPARLCAKCHGPIYRDWERGVHGRQNGYWDTEQGERTKLFCVQCHDPHAPKFPLMAPEPRPIRSRLALDYEPHEGV